MFIKATVKDSKKAKRIRNYVLKYNLDLYFSQWQSSWFLVKNADVSRTDDFVYILDLL